MIERLRRALEHLEELSPDMQDQLAEIIEEQTERPATPIEQLAGAWGDLPDSFDEMLDALDRIRHASPPTAPMDEQLAWMNTEDDREERQ